MSPSFRITGSSSPQQALIELIQRNVDLHHVILLPLDKIPDDEVEGAAVGQGVAGPADQVPGPLQIQLQRQCQGDGRGLGGPGIGVVDDLGEQLLGNVGALVDGRIFQSLLQDQLPKPLGEARILGLEKILQGLWCWMH